VSFTQNRVEALGRGGGLEEEEVVDVRVGEVSRNNVKQHFGCSFKNSFCLESSLSLSISRRVTYSMIFISFFISNIRNTYNENMIKNLVYIKTI